MKPILLALALLSGAAFAETPLIGHYRFAGGPDVAGELVIGADHRFRYAFGGGALDERAEGLWQFAIRNSQFRAIRAIPGTQY